MNIALRVLLVIASFFAAIACYVFGIPMGGVAFLLLGIIFEGLFWVGIFGGKRKIAESK